MCVIIYVTVHVICSECVKYFREMKIDWDVSVLEHRHQMTCALDGGERNNTRNPLAINLLWTDNPHTSCSIRTIDISNKPLNQSARVLNVKICEQ